MPVVRVKGKSSLDSSGKARKVTWADDVKKERCKEGSEDPEERSQEDWQGEGEGAESKAQRAGKDEGSEEEEEEGAGAKR